MRGWRRLECKAERVTLTTGSRPVRGEIARTIVNLFAVIAALLIVYWLMPVQDVVNAGWFLRLALGLVLTVALLVWELRSIPESRRPVIRAIRALAASILMFLVVFALTYLSISHANPSSFSEHLDKVSAMYFTVTTLSTVGFGDIVPLTQTARVLVTVQMLLDIIVLAVTARLLLRTASQAVSRRQAATDDAG